MYVNAELLTAKLNDDYFFLDTFSHNAPCRLILKSVMNPKLIPRNMGRPVKVKVRDRVLIKTVLVFLPLRWYL